MSDIAAPRTYRALEISIKRVDCLCDRICHVGAELLRRQSESVGRIRRFGHLDAERN
jgi:hypothetical protein